MALSTRLPRTAAGSVGPFSPGVGLPGPAFSTSTNMRWQRATRDTERRQGPRRTLRCALRLTDNNLGQHSDPAVIPAECSNISNGGLYGIVPIGYGVAIGQRYTFQLTIGERGPEPGIRQIVSQQGEIVRAELLLGEDGYGDRVGIGVRLFGPRSGLVPMPMTA